MAIRYIVPAAGLALALAALAHAQPAGTRQALAPTMAMQAMDADKDGTISKSELDKAAIANFAALDADHDGTLDRKELLVGGNPRAMTQADRDQDGTLDQKEFTSKVDAGFNGADADHDGTLDRNELRAPQGQALLSMLPNTRTAEAAESGK